MPNFSKSAVVHPEKSSMFRFLHQLERFGGKKWWYQLGLLISRSFSHCRGSRLRNLLIKGDDGGRCSFGNRSIPLSEKNIYQDGFNIFRFSILDLLWQGTNGAIVFVLLETHCQSRSGEDHRIFDGSNLTRAWALESLRAWMAFLEKSIAPSTPPLNMENSVHEQWANQNR